MFKISITLHDSPTQYCACKTTRWRTMNLDAVGVATSTEAKGQAYGNVSETAKTCGNDKEKRAEEKIK